MPVLSCHCGGVKLKLASPPTEAAECNCSICRKLAWTLAYYAPAQVQRLTPPEREDRYMRSDMNEPPCLAVHRCKTCGIATHWQSLDPNLDRMGINVRLVEGIDPDALPRRFIDGASW
jgi:hypothetical protein